MNFLPRRRAKGFGKERAGLCHTADLAGQQLPSGKHWLSLAIRGWWGYSSLLHNFAAEEQQKHILNSILIKVQEVTKQSRELRL